MPLPAGYRDRQLSPRLTRSVEAFWTHRAARSGASLVLPDGRCDIILRYNELDRTPPHLVLTGPATRAFSVPETPGDCWLGLRLRPSFGHLLWGERLAQMQDKTLREAEAHAVLAALTLPSSAQTPRQLARLLQQALPNPIDERQPPDLTEALDLLHLTGGRMPVSDLADRMSLSPRQLQRRFVNAVGLSPKIYAQLIQFHRALRLIHNAGLPLSAASFEAGYNDQSHMTRAFKRFGGFTPADLPPNLTLPQLHVAISDIDV